MNRAKKWFDLKIFLKISRRRIRGVYGANLRYLFTKCNQSTKPEIKGLYMRSFVRGKISFFKIFPIRKHFDLVLLYTKKP